MPRGKKKRTTSSARRARARPRRPSQADRSRARRPRRRAARFLRTGRRDAIDSGAWADDGARDLAQWLWMRYGISDWKARRWIDAAHALPCCRRTSHALDRGELGIDKVVELTRFAQPETEDGLVTWAQRVSAGSHPARGRRRAPRRADEADTATTRRGRCRGRTRTRAGDSRCMPIFPLRRGPTIAQGDRSGRRRDPADARRTGLASVRCAPRGRAGRRLLGAARDRPRPRACDGRHPRARGCGEHEGAEVEGGGVAHTSTLSGCCAPPAIETVHEDADRADGDRHRPHHAGAAGVAAPAGPVPRPRVPVPGLRQRAASRRRTTSCSGATAAPPTSTTSSLLCSWHHKLVHEYGWWIKGSAEGDLRWYRPDGARYRGRSCIAHGPPALTSAHSRSARPGARAAGRPAPCRRSGSPGSTSTS